MATPAANLSLARAAARREIKPARSTIVGPLSPQQTHALQTSVRRQNLWIFRQELACYLSPGAMPFSKQSSATDRNPRLPGVPAGSQLIAVTIQESKNSIFLIIMEHKRPESRCDQQSRKYNRDKRSTLKFFKITIVPPMKSNMSV